jgi:hypothetical protein
VDNFTSQFIGNLQSPARFDWYQGSAFVDSNTLRGILSESVLGAEWEDLERVPHGYAFGWRLSDDSGRVADVWSGGNHHHPHFVASGPTAQVVCDVVRSELANHHSVSRADPCIDFDTPGAYDLLQSMALSVAKQQRIKVGTAGDHLLTMEGRTLYLGASTSHVRLRLYDKAAELRTKFANMPDVLAEIPDELARLEGQIRPKTPDAKRSAAKASPVELFGAAHWMRILMGQVSGLDIQPFQAGAVWRKSDDDRAYAAMLSQYGNLLLRMREKHGDAACVGLQIFDDLADLRSRNSQGR